MFPIDRAHACPAFEAYKLGDGRQASIQQVQLPQRVLGPSLSTAVPLGYKELKARAMHSPLATHDGSSGAYIAEDRSVILVSWMGEDVSSTLLAMIPPSVYSRTSEHLPMLLAADASTWLVSGETDLLLWMHYDASSSASECKSGTLSLPVLLPPVPEAHWTLVQATTEGQSLVYVLLQRACRVTSDRRSTSSSGLSATSHTLFDVMLIRATLPLTGGECASELMWCVQCDEPVSYARIEGGSCLLGTETPIVARSDPRPASEAPHSHTQAPTLPLLQKAPYTWTQTEDTVMVALTLPEYIRSEHIRTHFSLHGLSVSLAAAALPSESAAAMPGEQALRAGAFTSQSVWGQLDPTGCVWTLEAGASMQLLTLHLAKAHEGTRWPHVFAHDDHVLETLDPSELAAMLEGVDKYTQTMPSSTLLHDTLEDDVPEAGVPLQLTWIGPEGQQVTAPTSSHALLARATPPSDPALLLQHDVDGQVFVPPSPLAWTAWHHSATVPAISYVLASKRDVHPIYVYRGTSPPTVLAAEPRHAPDAHSRGSHLYVYGAAGPQRGTSYVWPLGDATTGPILAVTVSPDAALNTPLDAIVAARLRVLGRTIALHGGLVHASADVGQHLHQQCPS
ncbi:hypothetical protein MEQU1_000394 [Malassezia equina]|uniref:NudC domain-containing protein 1 n=1 Tax=Malassezia equina TaxID=1381935 RepID=A0AAF0EB04_9BASI|nr:hypothetical protein MEQU1_000394 [Malassezia equina]